MSRARDMANLGAQAGSGFDASDLTTGTLGNTVQDNITRLGTVTTGTMNNTIGSSATFPTGHVVQTVTKTASTSSDTTTSAEVANISGDSSSFEKQITITSGNKVLVTLSAIMSFTYTGIDVGGSLGIYVTQSASTSAVYDQTGGLGQYLYLGQNEEWNYYQQLQLSLLHTPSVTNPTYKPYIRPYLTSTVRLRCSAGSPFIITLQEIQA